MTFPKFVKFEETQEVLFSSVEVGQEFKFNGRAWIRKDFKEAPIQLGAEVNSHRLLRFYDDNIVTTHRPLETKPLGECKPGDVVRCPEGDIGYLLHDSDDYILLRDDLVPIAMYGDHEIAAWSRRLTVTIIGKVVCDG